MAKKKPAVKSPEEILEETQADTIEPPAQDPICQVCGAEHNRAAPVVIVKKLPEGNVCTQCFIKGHGRLPEMPLS